MILSHFAFACPARLLPLLRKGLGRMTPLLFLFLLLACYDPNPIQSLSLSPDGRYAAVLTAQGELGLMDLAKGGSLTIYSRFASRGMAWSPDSRALAFVEQFRNAPSALWLLDPLKGRAPAPLVANTAWKADPIWLTNEKVAYLSDLDADNTNVWTVEVKTGATAHLLGRATDISHLWGNPQGNSFIYQRVEGGSSELWFWRQGAALPVRLTVDRPADPAEERCLAFSADGKAVAFFSPHATHMDLVWFDLIALRERDRLKLERPVDELTVLRDGRVAADEGSHLLLWRPNAPWYRRSVAESGWDRIPLGSLAPWKGKGLALIANQNIILLAENPERIPAGKIHVRQIEDLLALAAAQARQGQFGPARRILGDLQDQARKDPKNAYLLDVAWSQLERLAAHWRPADKWLSRAAQAVAPDSVERDLAWRERLALAFFGAKDPPRALGLISQLTGETKKAPLATWVAGFTKDQRELQKSWMQVGGALRRGDYPLCALQTYKLLAADTPTTASLQGLGLLLNGDFEPLGDVADLNKKNLENLLAQHLFQLALLKASHQHNSAGPVASDLRAMLLMQWIQEGDLNSARTLTRETLAAGESISDYLEMLRQYLVAEETDRRIERAVTDILLKPDIAQTLTGMLTAEGDLLILRLAQVKKFLVESNLAQAKASLNEARILASQKPPQEGDPKSFDQTRNLFLIQLFETKIHERRGDWTHALAGYQACLDLMRQAPGNWDVAAYEITFMSGLLETAAKTDPDLLRSYLGILRGMGDSLVNPTHDPLALATVLDNIQTLRHVAPEPWITPYLTFSQGMCYSLLNRPWQALYYLELARHQKPSLSLLQRILLEEAAVRDTLGQHALAARLYSPLFEMRLPTPVRASAILATIQSEMACGAISAPSERLSDLLRQELMPRPWRQWLWMQVGTGSESTPDKVED